MISTLLVLVAGMLIAIFVVKFGNLDVTSAYLATSPGGLNVVVGLAADMGPNAPIVLAYQMVRLYTIILTVPLRRPDFAQIPELKREKRKRKGRFEGASSEMSGAFPRGFQCRKTQGIPFKYIHESVPGRPFSRRLDEGIRKRVLSHHRAPKPLATVIY